jgi:hypothetical protein
MDDRPAAGNQGDFAPSISAYQALKMLTISMLIEQANQSGNAGGYAQSVFDRSFELADTLDDDTSEAVRNRLMELGEEIKSMHDA